MSSDNGIYILQTYGPEYRVVYTQNIDEIYGIFSSESGRWLGNNEAILSLFEESPVFTDLDNALDLADKMSYDYEFLEYGICLITDFAELNFNGLRESHGEEPEQEDESS